MSPKTEQTLVGLFVLVAGGILLVAVFAINGAFGGTARTYHAYFQFAGGLEPGATVRYSGGPKVGRVESLRIDPKDPTHIDLTFSVQPDVLVKTDSKVKIMSLSPLGDNHLELYPGSAQAGAAPAGSLLAFRELRRLQRPDRTNQQPRAASATTRSNVGRAGHGTQSDARPR